MFFIEDITTILFNKETHWKNLTIKQELEGSAETISNTSFDRLFTVLVHTKPEETPKVIGNF